MKNPPTPWRLALFIIVIHPSSTFIIADSSWFFKTLPSYAFCPQYIRLPELRMFTLYFRHVPLITSSKPVRFLPPLQTSARPLLHMDMPRATRSVISRGSHNPRYCSSVPTAAPKSPLRRTSQLCAASLEKRRTGDGLKLKKCRSHSWACVVYVAACASPSARSGKSRPSRGCAGWLKFR